MQSRSVQGVQQRSTVFRAFSSVQGVQQCSGRSAAFRLLRVRSEGAGITEPKERQRMRSFSRRSVIPGVPWEMQAACERAEGIRGRGDRALRCVYTACWRTSHYLLGDYGEVALVVFGEWVLCVMACPWVLLGDFKKRRSLRRVL